MMKTTSWSWGKRSSLFCLKKVWSILLYRSCWVREWYELRDRGAKWARETLTCRKHAWNTTSCCRWGMWTRPTAMRASSNTQKLQFPGFNWKHYFKTFFTKYDFIFWNIWFYILEYLGFMFWNLGFMFWNIWVSCSGNICFIYCGIGKKQSVKHRLDPCSKKGHDAPPGVHFGT